MKVTIVTIGDEILIGQIVDTNSAWIADQLINNGFVIEKIISIADDSEQIKQTIDSALQTSNVVLLTGGLGPTRDDITKKTLCEYFNTELVLDESVLENIKNVIANRFPLNYLTRDQAYVPKNCTVIQNTVGTAPTTWFDKDTKVVVSMPGVPYEMKHVMSTEIISRLRDRFESVIYLKAILQVVGYTESALAIHLSNFEDNLPKSFGLAYLPSFGLIKLRLFVYGEENRDNFEAQLSSLEILLGDSLLIEEDVEISNILAQKLLERKLTIGLAESCTGGNISHQLTLIAGASAFLHGAVVSYSNESKTKMLGVDSLLIDKYGAVSEPVVKSMAKGIQDRLGVDCAIAVSGIVGPSGGTVEKPIGLVYIATILYDKILVKEFRFRGISREVNIMRASYTAILQMIEMLNDNAK